MASKTAVVRFTANFETNLEHIAAFWSERQAPQAFSHLLDELADTVVGNLEQHPRIGRKFFARSPQSLEVRERVQMLRKRFADAEVREYLSGDYLLLYAVVAQRVARKPGLTVYLLAIKHHRQLSFDFDGFWRANRGEDS